MGNLQSPAQAQPSALSSPVPSLAGSPPEMSRLEYSSGMEFPAPAAPEDPANSGGAQPGAPSAGASSQGSENAPSGPQPKGYFAGLSEKAMNAAGAGDLDAQQAMQELSQMDPDTLAAYKELGKMSEDKTKKEQLSRVLGASEVGTRVAATVGTDAAMTAGGGVAAAWGPLVAGFVNAGAGAIVDQVTDAIRSMNDIPQKHQDKMLGALAGLVDIASVAFPGLAANAIMSPVINGAQSSAAFAGSVYSGAGGAQNAQEAAKLSSDAEGLGVKLNRSQLFPNSVEAQQEANRVAQSSPQAFRDWLKGQQQDILEARDKIMAVMREGMDPEAGSLTHVKDYFHQIEEGYSTLIQSGFNKGLGLSRNQKTDVTALFSQLRGELGGLGISFNADGSVKSIADASAGSGDLARVYQRFYDANARAHAMFSDTGGHVPRGSAYGGKSPYYGASFKVTPGEVSSEYQNQMDGPYPIEGKLSKKLNFNTESKYTPPGAQHGTYETQGEAPSLSGQNLPPNASGGSTMGLTLQELEDMRHEFKRFGNFNAKGDLTPSQQSARKAYGMTVDRRDDRLMEVFQKEGLEGDAMALRHNRDEYKFHKDLLSEVQGKIDKDPTNAIEALIKPNDPKSAEAALKLMNSNQRKNAKSIFLNNLSKSFDENSNGALASLGAQQTAAKWAKVDPKIKNLLYTQDEISTIDKLVNVAKAVDSKNPESLLAVMSEPAVKEYVRILASPKSGMISRAADWIYRSFKNENVREFLNAKFSAPSTVQGAMGTAQAATLAQRVNSLMLKQKMLRQGSQAAGAGLTSAFLRQ